MKETIERVLSLAKFHGVESHEHIGFKIDTNDGILTVLPEINYTTLRGQIVIALDGLGWYHIPLTGENEDIGTLFVHNLRNIKYKKNERNCEKIRARAKKLFAPIK